MRIQNAQRVSEAIQTLSAGTSLDTLVDRLYDLTDGTLALDRATLHRIARGKTQVARAIDSPEECIRLYFALMILGCERAAGHRRCRLSCQLPGVWMVNMTQTA